MARQHNGLGVPGPSLPDMFALAREHMTTRDITRLLDAVIFNIAIGNVDSHAKDYSILLRPAGPELAPLYDLMTGLAWTNITQNHAQDIDTQRRGRHIYGRHWRRMAEQCGLAPPATTRRVKAICERILRHLPTAAAVVAEMPAGSEHLDLSSPPSPSGRGSSASTPKPTAPTSLPSPLKWSMEQAPTRNNGARQKGGFASLSAWRRDGEKVRLTRASSCLPPSFSPQIAECSRDFAQSALEPPRVSARSGPRRDHALAARSRCSEPRRARSMAVNNSATWMGLHTTLSMPQAEYASAPGL